MKELDRIEELFKQYQGKITHAEAESEYYQHEVSITSKNFIRSYYKNGEVHKQGNVDCFVNVHYDASNKDYGIDAYERTYEILGGSGVGLCTIDEVMAKAEAMLERYNFKKKEPEQISLF